MTSLKVHSSIPFPLKNITWIAATKYETTHLPKLREFIVVHPNDNICRKTPLIGFLLDSYRLFKWKMMPLLSSIYEQTRAIVISIFVIPLNIFRLLPAAKVHYEKCVDKMFKKFLPTWTKPHLRQFTKYGIPNGDLTFQVNPVSFECYQFYQNVFLVHPWHFCHFISFMYPRMRMDTSLGFIPLGYLESHCSD